MKGLKIDDHGKITSKNEEKKFTITLESFGTGGCLLIDFKDGTKNSYGDEYFCIVEWERAKEYEFVPGFGLQNPMTIAYSFK